MTRGLKSLDDCKRIVVKIGSALLVDRKSGLKKAWLDAICADIAELKARGVEVLVVLLGRNRAWPHRARPALRGPEAGRKPGRRSRRPDRARARLVAEPVAARHRRRADPADARDTEERRRYLNARATLQQLLKLGAVPIINENDTVATTEIRYGDNDRLAARVATMAGAELLVLLSDIDGLYTAPPHLDPDARFLARIEEITPEIEAMAGGAPLNCRAAACAPRSTPARSQPAPAAP